MSPVSEGRRRSGRAISDAAIGYASRLPRQASVKADLKHLCLIAEMNDGTAPLTDGMYLYVVMVGDPDRVRLIHEDSLVAEGVLAGHTSLVQRDEFVRGWAKSWDEDDPEFRHTVLYAGELDYREGEGVMSWNNRSGHYMPDSDNHTRIGFDPAKFIPCD